MKNIFTVMLISTLGVFSLLGCEEGLIEQEGLAQSSNREDAPGAVSGDRVGRFDHLQSSSRKSEVQGRDCLQDVIVLDMVDDNGTEKFAELDLVSGQLFYYSDQRAGDYIEAEECELSVTESQVEQIQEQLASVSRCEVVDQQDYVDDLLASIEAILADEELEADIQVELLRDLDWEVENPSSFALIDASAEEEIYQTLVDLPKEGTYSCLRKRYHVNDHGWDEYDGEDRDAEGEEEHLEEFEDGELGEDDSDFEDGSDDEFDDDSGIELEDDEEVV